MRIALQRAFLIAFFVWLLLPPIDSADFSAEARRSVLDSRGVEVLLPARIERVATISDGLVEGVMTVFGVEERLVGIGSRVLQKVWSYRFSGARGETFTYNRGMHPLRLLNPWFADLPLIAEGPAVSYETLLSLDPDLLILRMGDCNLPRSDERSRMMIDRLDHLGIATVVLYGPYYSGNPDPSDIGAEIRILGRVFEREKKAEELAGYIKEKLRLVQERTRGIPPEEQPCVLVLGLSPAAREKGAAGQVFGTDTIESYFIEELVNAKNAFSHPGHFKLIDTEHLLALNPDVIILSTAAGYHPPRELLEAPYYQHLQHLDAVRQKRVAALPWSPWNCEKRLEYPIDVMVIAKAAYPERFGDIEMAGWLLDFYQGLYEVDRETAEQLRSAQWMDWTVSGKQ